MFENAQKTANAVIEQWVRPIMIRRGAIAWFASLLQLLHLQVLHPLDAALGDDDLGEAGLDDDHK